MNKRFTSIVISAIMIVLTLANSVFIVSADTNISVSCGVGVYVDGHRLGGIDTFIYDGTAYLPARAVSEALGKNVEWDSESRTVLINGTQDSRISETEEEVESYGTNIDISVKTGIRIVVDGAKLNTAEGMIYNGTTYVPARAISEALGKSVLWDEEQGKIFVYNAPVEYDNGIATKGFALFSADDKFHEFEFTRRAPEANDIVIDILYSSICHSDVHAGRGQHGSASYADPMVPGHEMVGVVTQVGSEVTKFKVGDYAGVGTYVGTCGECEECLAGNEQDCEAWPVWTYNSYDKYHDNEITRGGFSDTMVVNSDYAVLIPENADLERTAPLLCAGITVYSPITFSEVSAGQKVGVAGFGGLGDMAVRFMQAIGADITAFDVNENKRQLAEDMGIDFVNVNNSEELEGLNNSFDFIISTIPASYNPFTYINMLKKGGELAIVGQPSSGADIAVSMLPFSQHRYVYGSMTGGIDQMQDMINYCVDNNIYPDVEMIETTGEELDRVFDLLDNNEGNFRYVMDMSKLD